MNGGKWQLVGSPFSVFETMNKLSIALLAVVAASLVVIAVSSLSCGHPLKTGVLNGNIVFQDNQQSQADVGSRIEFYESFVVVSVFNADAKNPVKEVHPLDQIRMIRLQ